MGGGRDFATGKSIYVRRDGRYYRRDGKEMKHRGKDVPATLKKFNGNVHVGDSRYNGMSESEKQDIQAGIAAIQEYINKSDFRIRVTPKAMRGILDSGEVWNQMQTGTSKGMYDPDERRDISRRLFGHDGNLADEEYEKYGYLSDGQPEVAYWYGDFDIVLKKDALMDRTTITFGDSLDFDVRYPSYVNNPRWVSSGEGMYATPKEFRERAERLLQYGKFYPGGDGYAELQFHGKVTVNDISHISMPRSWEFSKTIEQRRIVNRLEKEGIEIRYDAHD